MIKQLTKTAPGAVRLICSTPKGPGLRQPPEAATEKGDKTVEKGKGKADKWDW